MASINPGNVNHLKVAWTYRTGEPLTAVEGGGRPPAFEATAVYANSLLYISTPFGKVIALDPLTGTERWKFDAEINRKGNYGDFTSRGVTAWQDRIFFASIDARLFAIDARTGKRCEDFGDHGHIDLTKGLRRGPLYAGEYEETTPPAVVDGLVIVGSAIADNVRLNAPTPEVRAFDAHTGALRWTWDPLTGSPNAGAGNAWSRITVDPERHLVFVPTGSASPDYYGGLRPGDNLYANSVVALRSQTGAMVWHFQTVHHDLWDYDVASPPALVTVRRGGKAIPAVAVGSKTGHIFLLDRVTGKPLFPVEERPVPKSDVPGEEASPTQPFPTLPPPLASQHVTSADASGRTEADRKWCEEQMTGLRAEGIFTPPSLQGTLVAPGNIGGLHWGGIAADSTRGLLIAPSNNLTAVVRLVPRDQVAAYRKEHPDWETTAQVGTPYAMSRMFLLTPSHIPCNPPPYGMLTAVDTETGKFRWQASLPSITLGGPLIAGDLVFLGATPEPVIRAFDIKTGQELWKGDLPASARSTPMTFRASNGKQFIVIAAGGHEPFLGKLDNALVAFTLP